MKKNILILIGLLFAVHLIAQPTTITYQGKLLDNTNMPVNQTGVPFTFAIYDASSGGTKLWPSGVSVSKSIDVVYGLYSVALGTGVGGDDAFTASMFTGTTPYLEVVVDGSTLPRTPLTNVPFSLIANQLSASGWASPGSIGSTTPGTATFTGLTMGSGVTNYVMPGVRGSNNQVLQTDGSGNVSWSTVGVVPQDFMITSTSSTAPSGYSYSGISTRADSIVWTSKASLPTARRELAVCVGKGNATNSVIYAMGGFNGSCLNINEAYDPVSNTWSTRASMISARKGHGIAEVNKKIYAVGGVGDAAVVSFADEYNYSSNTWTRKDSTNYNLAGFGTVAIDDNIYLIGGGSNFPEGNFSSISGNFQKYNVTNDTFMNVSATSAFSYFFFPGTAACVVNGKIYLAGAVFHSSTTFMEYDPSTGNLYEISNLSTGRAGLNLVPVGSEIYAIGGATGLNTFLTSGTPSSLVEIYNVNTGTWRTGPSLPSARYAAGGVNWNGRVFIIGGYDGSNYLSNNLEMRIWEKQLYYHKKN